MLQKKQSIIGSVMIHWYNMYACFPLFVNHAAKLLHFFDICKMERDFSMRIMPKEVFPGNPDKPDCYANPEKGVVIVLSLFRSANVVLILC